MILARTRHDGTPTVPGGLIHLGSFDAAVFDGDGTKVHSARMGRMEARRAESDPPEYGHGAEPIVVDYVPEHRIVLARFRGNVTVAMAREGVAAIKREVGAHAVEGVLIDVRDCEYTPTTDEAAAFAQEFGTMLGRRRLAFVTRLLVQYGIARLIAYQAQMFGVAAAVFQDEPGALAWLHSPDTR
jgi:hypothetical protein